jgi:peroxiredoxin
MKDVGAKPVRAAAWMRAVLAAAALYNLAWGSWVLIDPGALFRLTDIPQPVYPQIWQLVGMIVGVYGVGYAVAATAPLRHWPIVLVGLLGKLFGPVGFLAAALGGTLPWAWGWTILTNDVVWWIPFALILAAARRDVVGSRTSGDRSRPSVSLAFRMARCQNGESLLSLSRRRPRLVVCLRHLGCTFCSESLADLARLRSQIESTGTGIVLVHPGDSERAVALFESHGLADLPRLADPDRILYRALGLERGSFLQLLGPRVLWRAAAAALQGHRPGRTDGDAWQMPGVFLVHDGRIVEAFRHRDVADKPDYHAIASRLRQGPDAEVGRASG